VFYGFPFLEREVRNYYFNKVKWKSRLDRHQFLRLDDFFASRISYYKQLDLEGRAKFIHRALYYLEYWSFEGRRGMVIDPEKKLMVCGSAAQLTYGLTDFHIPHFEKIILYPDTINILDPRIDPLEVRMRIGMVFQKPNPFPKSIYENVAYGLRIRGQTARRFLDERIERALQEAALWEEVKDRLHGPASALSGGQQQRLCIARALATDPELMLFDEPSSALDPIATARIEELVMELKKKVTILIVTHNMQQAARVSDHTAFMYLGEVIEVGPTDKIFTNPSNRLTEDYVTGRFG